MRKLWDGYLTTTISRHDHLRWVNQHTRATGMRHELGKERLLKALGKQPTGPDQATTMDLEVPWQWFHRPPRVAVALGPDT